MKQVAGKIAMLAVLALLLMPVMAAQAQKESSPRSDSMGVWQARRTLTANFVPDHTTKRWGTIDGNSFRFTPNTLEFDSFGSKAGAQHFTIDLKTLESVSATCKVAPFGEQRLYYCSLKNAAAKDLSSDYFLQRIWNQGVFNFACDPKSVEFSRCSADRKHAAESFVAAVERLRAFANDAGAPLRTLPQQMAAWRALASKPPVPEEVRVQRLLAEDAVKGKRPEEALIHFETGLELYPTWPQGYFNAALIAAELGFYAHAVEHMQAYLDLVPDAQDAQSAHDQIVIWQYKAKKTSAN